MKQFKKLEHGVYIPHPDKLRREKFEREQHTCGNIVRTSVHKTIVGLGSAIGAMFLFIF